MGTPINPNLVEIVKVTELPTLELALENYFAHCGIDGILYKIDIQGLVDFIAPYVASIGGSGFIGVSGTVLPNPTSQDNAFTFVKNGIYTQTTGGNVITTEELNLLSWNGTTWSLVFGIDLGLDGYLLKTEIEFDYDVPPDGENILNRLSIIKGHYMVTSGVFDTDITTVNWIRYPIIDFLAGQSLNVKDTFLPAGSPLAIFLDASNVLVSQVLSDGSNNQNITAPAGTFKLALNLAAKVGVATNPTPTDNPIALVVKATSLDEASAVVSILDSKLKAAYLSDEVKFYGDIVDDKNPVTKEYFEANKASGNLFYDGAAFPSLSLGVDTDKYIDTNTNRLYIKKNGSWGSGINIGGTDTDFTYPAEFTWHPVSFIKQSNGFYIPSIIDIETFIQADIDSLTEYFVDGVNGSDSNNGLSESTPFKSVGFALTSGARNILLMDGHFGRLEQMPSRTDTSETTPLIIRAINPGKVSFATSDNGGQYTWVADENVWKVVRTNMGNVLDMRELTSDGFFSSYTLKSTIAEVKATARTWCYIGTTVYINTLDGLKPDTNVLLALSVISPTYIPGENVPYFYISGIDFYCSNGVSALTIKNNVSIQYATKAYVNGCKFISNNRGNGLGIDNMLEAWVQNCSGYDNLRDSLNYHTSLLSSGYTPMKVVEINGYSIRTGQGSAEASSNGSTTHEGIIIIRIGGNFGIAMGPVVADVNNGARSLNFNVTAYKSTYSNSASFNIQGSGSIMWLFGCTSLPSPDDSPNSVWVRDSGAIMYYDSETSIPLPHRIDSGAQLLLYP